MTNTGGGDYATAIHNGGASPKIKNVTAEASGGATYTVGIRNDKLLSGNDGRDGDEGENLWGFQHRRLPNDDVM